MSIAQSNLKEFYGEIEAVSQRYGLTVPDAVLVLAMETSARGKRSNLQLIVDDTTESDS